MDGDYGAREWCEAEVTLTTTPDGKVRLSICGSAGDIWDRTDAEAHAHEYWASFFEDQPEEMYAMGERFGTCFCGDVEKAANFVLAQDGDLHGLDVHDEDGDDVYITHSCGQIRETLARFFPELTDYFHWHLNDMRASADGESWEYEPLPENVLKWAQNFGA
jgi:hypothetical protein